MRHAPLMVPLLLAAAAAALAEAQHSPLKCSYVQVPKRNANSSSALSYLGDERKLWVAWSKDADRAAAALLLQVLAKHSRCNKLRCQMALCYVEGGLRTLLGPPTPNVNKTELDTAFVAGFELNSALGYYYERLYSGVGGAPPVPYQPQKHVALSAAAAKNVTCRAAAHPDFFDNKAEAKACNFESIAEPAKDSVPTTAKERLELLQRVRDGKESFRFLDAEMWDDEERVMVQTRSSDPALLATERMKLVMHAPWLLRAMLMHAPPTKTLRELLELESDEPGDKGYKALQAARVWARSNSEEFNAMITKTKPEILRYRALVYRCAGDMEENEWKRGTKDTIELLLDTINESLTNRTVPRLVDVQLEAESLDCLSHSQLREKLQEKQKQPGAHRLLGVVAVGAGVPEAARHAADADSGVPLVSYDVQAAHGALEAGARVEALAEALSEMLAACGWRRVAVLSEDTPAAAALAATLAAVGPVRREALSPKDVKLRETLRALRSVDARVFIINAGSVGVWRTLSLAAQEKMTPANGYQWVAREWTWPEPPPLLPLRTLRFGPRSASPGDRTFLLAKLWPSGDWPAVAAPLVDALSMLVLGSTRLFEKHEELRYDHRNTRFVELHRRIITDGEPLRIIGRNITFDKRGALQPTVQGELWREGETRPMLHRCGECPDQGAADRARNCTMPVGDSFAPTCLDALVAFGTPALLLLALLVGGGVARLKRRAKAKALKRERRMRAEASAALLLRQRDTGPKLAKLLVERERVTLLHALGSGRHGRVWLAEVAPHGERRAAKAPHKGCSPAEEGELLREAAAMAQLDHPHVLRLLGVCVGPGPPLLLSAVAPHGDLLSYVRRRRPPAGEASEAAHVAAPALTRLAREAALALAYLAERGIVHCDVRAANCLVDERRELKLADFGMARSLGGGGGGGSGEEGGGAKDEYYSCRRRALFPVLWMAPESLTRGAFSPLSDVWALGVLALELVTLGARPFGALGAADAVALVSRGGHARLPAAASAETRQLARACWRREARDRPTAREVAEWLASRPSALAPAPTLDKEDGDSGFGEPPPSAIEGADDASRLLIDS